VQDSLIYCIAVLQTEPKSELVRFQPEEARFKLEVASFGVVFNRDPEVTRLVTRSKVEVANFGALLGGGGVVVLDNCVLNRDCCALVVVTEEPLPEFEARPELEPEPKLEPKPELEPKPI